MPYNFTAEDFNKFSEDILKAEGDQATLTSLLADMNGTITDAIAKDVANTEKVDTVTAENKRLRDANMQLFLRVGQVVDKQDKETSKEDDEKPHGIDDYMQSYFEKIDKEKK